MRLCLFFSVIGLLVPHDVIAASWESLYDTQVLEKEKPQLQEQLDDLLAKEIRPYLNERETHALAGVQIELPAMGLNPLDFCGGKGRLTLPLLTLQFTEDLAEAYAWLWANHYSSETVDEYMGMLHYQPPGAFPDARYPAPLTALHIPANALDTPAVKNMFAKVRTTAWAFLFLHAFDHLRNTEDSEQQADLFALEVMKRNSEVPFRPADAHSRDAVSARGSRRDARPHFTTADCNGKLFRFAGA